MNYCKRSIHVFRRNMWIFGTKSNPKGAKNYCTQLWFFFTQTYTPILHACFWWNYRHVFNWGLYFVLRIIHFYVSWIKFRYIYDDTLYPKIYINLPFQHRQIQFFACSAPLRPFQTNCYKNSADELEDVFGVAILTSSIFIVLFLDLKYYKFVSSMQRKRYGNKWNYNKTLYN